MQQPMQQEDIFKVLQNLQNTDPLDPDPEHDPDHLFRDWYVSQLGGASDGDVIERLKLQILASVGGHHAYLFTGTIGSGKSTELRRLAYSLKQAKQFATVINIADYLNPQENLGLPDVLMAVALGAGEAAAKVQGIAPEVAQRLLAWWDNLLAMRLEGKELEIGGGPLKLKLALKNNPSYRQRLRQFLEGGLDELVRETNQFLQTTAEQICSKRGMSESGKCVLLVDSLEQFGSSALAGHEDPVLQSLIALFNHHGSQLRFGGWSVVYSVPPLLQKLAPGVTAHFPSTSYLTSAHVFVDRKDEIDKATVDDKLLPLLKKRLGEKPAKDLFEEGVLRDMVVMSGGDLRFLLRIAADALLAGLPKNQFPINQTMVNKVYDVLRRPYLPLPKDVQERLAHVRKHKEPLLNTSADWTRAMSDLAAKRILLYLNGTEWYDVHPLLRSVPAEETDAA